MALRLRARHGGAKVIPLVLRDGQRTAMLLVVLPWIVFGWMMLHGAADPNAGESPWLLLVTGLFFVAAAALLLWQTFRPSRAEVRLGTATLSVRLQGRRYEAAWAEIADITDHDVPLWQRDQNNRPRITVRLKAPSGAPLDWLTIPDIFEIGRAELAAELRAALDAAATPAGLPSAYATASVEIARRDRELIRHVALLAILPLLLGLALLVSR